MCLFLHHHLERRARIQVSLIVVTPRGENTDTNPLILIFIGLKDDLLATQADAQSSKAQLEGEIALTGRLWTAINDLSTS